MKYLKVLITVFVITILHITSISAQVYYGSYVSGAAKIPPKGWEYCSVGSTSTTLNGNNIMAMATDSSGNKWIVTEYGLCKYNGVKWKNYKTEDGLLSNSVLSVAVDAHGNVWVSYAANGVSKFDGTQWTKYTKANGLTSDTSIYRVFADKIGNVWFDTRDGLCRFDGTSWVTYSDYKNITCLTTDNNGITYMGRSETLIKFDGTNWSSHIQYNSTINCISVDSKNNLWVGTNYGWHKLKDTLDPKIAISFPLKDKERIESIYIGKNDEIWMGSWNSKIYKLKDTTLSTYNFSDTAEFYNVNTITQDKDGIKWFGTYNGLLEYNGTKWKHHLPNGLVDDYVKAVAIDKQGNKWFGTNRGVSKFDGKKWIKYTTANGLINNFINSVSVDKDDNIWFGTYDGISKFDGTNWVNYTVANGLVDNSIHDIKFDINGHVWIATSNGVSEYDGLKWTSYKKSDNSYSNSFFAIAIDLKNNKWFATYKGLTKFDGTNWTTFTNSNSSASNYVMNVAVDKHNTIWVSTDAGFGKFDGNNWVNYNMINNYDSIKGDIIIDSNNDIWFCRNSWTYSGAWKFDGANWTKYTSEYSFDINSNTYAIRSLISNQVNSIAIDTLGNKWFATSDGISIFKDTSSAPINYKKTQIGYVFFDKNANGIKDNSENGIAGKIIEINNKQFSVSQESGIFFAGLIPGANSLSLNPGYYWTCTTDSTFRINTNENSTPDTIFIGLKPKFYDVSVNLSGSIARIESKSSYWINFSNRGILPQNGSVILNLNSLIKFIESKPKADSIIGNRIVWNYSSLECNDYKAIQLIVKMPDYRSFGRRLTSTVQITCNDKDNFLYNNVDTLRQVLMGPIDPNDKLVSPEGIGTEGKVLLNTPLTYTIRFQNTGTDTAFNVYIRDTLDSNFNIQTLSILASSHPCNFEIKGTNEVIFKFDNILLPDSNKNQPGSNGFIKYSISPKVNLNHNTLVKNKADIYFDYNPPVATNTVKNTYVKTLENPPTSQASNIIVSNIKTNEAWVAFTNGSGSKRAVFIKQDSVGLPQPINFTNYVADTSFSKGSQLASTGWYCIYNGVGNNVKIGNLTPNTKYRIMVVEYNGLKGFELYNVNSTTSNPVNFKTQIEIKLPEISTVTIYNITKSSSISGGNISTDGGAAITTRGICWNTSAAPTINNNKTTDGAGKGIFSSSLTGLTVNTKYYVRAYATNSAGTAYGNELSFTTSKNEKVIQKILFKPFENVFYNSPDFSPSASLSSGLPLTFSSTDTSVAIFINDKIHVKKPGVCYIKVVNAGNDTLTAVLDSQKLEVLKGNLFIIADNKTKTCGTENPKATVSYFGFVGSDDESILLKKPTVSSPVIKTSPVGIYALTPSGALAQYYSINYVNGEFKVLPLKSTVQNINICSKGFQLPSGKIVDKSGIYNDTLHSRNGCDSIVTINLNFIKPTAKLQEVKICKGTVYKLGSKVYSETGIYADTLYTTSHCDSLYVTTNLLVEDNLSLSLNNDTSICEGSNVTLTAKGIGKINWLNSTSSTLVVKPTTTTLYKAVSTNTCGIKYESVLISVYPKPEKPEILSSGFSIYILTNNKVQWFETGKGDISESHEWEYKPKSNGKYYAVVFNDGCSSDTSNEFNFKMPTEVESTDNNQYSLFPNPVSEEFTIESSNEFNSIELTNASGISINKLNFNSTKTLTFNMKSYSPGVYFVKIQLNNNRNETIVKRIAKL